MNRAHAMRTESGHDADIVQTLRDAIDRDCARHTRQMAEGFTRLRRSLLRRMRRDYVFGSKR